MNAPLLLLELPLAAYTYSTTTFYHQEDGPEETTLYTLHHHHHSISPQTQYHPRVKYRQGSCGGNVAFLCWQLQHQDGPCRWERGWGTESSAK